MHSTRLRPKAVSPRNADTVSQKSTVSYLKHATGPGRKYMNNDTVNLLRECNAGIKMGENAIKKVLPRVKDNHLKQALENCKNTHADLGDRTHGLLLSAGEDTKPPHAIAGIMSDMKISFMMAVNESDGEVASLMTDGCNMGIKSLCKSINKYKNADKRSRDIARELIASEEYLETTMRGYL